MALSIPCAKCRYPCEIQPMWVQSSTEYLWSSWRSKIADSAGESVNALNSDIAIENAIVSENCRYKIPVVPGKNDTGTKTEISTSEVATTALATPAMAAEVAECGSVSPWLMWRCTFSM